jgi:hypothetical protein
VTQQVIIPDLIESNSTLVKGINVYGAIIMSTYAHDTTIFNAINISLAREQNAREMYQQLPFPVMEWPAIITRGCPRYVKTQNQKSERGLTLAHYQIWLDFIYFDHEVLQLSQQPNFTNIEIISTQSTSKSGIFSYVNGTYYRNNAPFLDNDVLVIFEDDADIAVIDIQNTIQDELSTMTTDLVYLGWCNGRLARPVPLCAHAYAVTRAGCRKLVKYYEPCGLVVDEQFVIMAKNNWITFRVAHPWSYKGRFNSNYPKSYDSTHGIFHQKKMGSLNGH